MHGISISGPTAVRAGAMSWLFLHALFFAFHDRNQALNRDNNTSSNGGMRPKQWANSELSTPEFFEWLNTVPADVAERLGE